MALQPPSGQQQLLLKQAIEFHQTGRLNEAKAIYKQVLNLRPQNAEVLRLLGVAECQSGQLETGIRILRQSLETSPQQPDVYFRIGTALLDLGRFRDAILDFDHALRLKPIFVEALINRADCLYDLRLFEDAVADYDRALIIKPDSADAYFSRGNVLMELGRVEEALNSYDSALLIKPSFAEAIYNRGHTLQTLQRYDDALANYDRLLSVNDNFADVHLKRGNVLLAMNRFNEAIASYDKALQKNPSSAAGYRNRGVAQRGAGLLRDAGGSLDKALALKPDFADAYLDKGNVLQDLNRPEDALVQYEIAISIEPNLFVAHINRGNALQALERRQEALLSYEHALALKPDYEWLYGQAVMSRMDISDWSGFHDRIRELLVRISRGEKAIIPFQAQTVLDDPDALLKAAQIYTRANYLSEEVVTPIFAAPKHGKIRVGYFSSDFRNHPVAHLTAGMFEQHDKGRFEIYAFSLSARTRDRWQDRIANAVDHFLDVSTKSAAEIVHIAREFGIDIAVDLNGYTKDNRASVFAQRAAPIQVSYLGYLGSMGAPYIDYLIADETIVPEPSRQFYSEKIISLPSYQMNDRQLEPSERRFSKAELGLPETGFVFCSFNGNHKITPDTFTSWMRILRQVPDSVLWLYTANKVAEHNLATEASKQGVEPNRLIFAPWMALNDHLSRQSAADLFLDAHPYNAGVTASNALRVCLPVLTRIGKSFSARMGASLLKAVGLQELVTRTPEEYEALAIKLATNPAYLSRVRRTLAENLPNSALFNTALSTKYLERAYTAIFERFQLGLQPDHISIRSK